MPNLAKLALSVILSYIFLILSFDTVSIELSQNLPKLSLISVFRADNCLTSLLISKNSWWSILLSNDILIYILLK